MFENEDEEEWLTPDFKQQLASFEKMYQKNAYSFIDADNMEIILDHLIATNQLRKANWAAMKVLEHFPTNSLLIIRYSQVLSLMGKTNKALQILLELADLEPNNVEVLLSVAACYSQLKDNKQAITYFKEAFQYASGEDKVEIAIDLAIEYENIDDYHAAISVLKSVAQEGQTNESLIYELGHCYEKIDDFQNAIKCFEDYINEEPYSFTTWYNLGNVYVKNNQLDKAVWAFDYAVLIEENFIPALYNLANTYFDLHLVEKALCYYKKCLSLDQEDPMIFCAIGECYEELGEFETAYEMYDKSTALFSNYSDAWLGKGIVSNELGFTKRGINELTIALDVEPNRSEIWRALGSVYENDGQEAQARISYEKAIELDADDKENVISYLSFLAGISVNEVFQAVEENAKLKENKYSALVLCYCHWKTGNHTEAMLIFDEIIETSKPLARDLLKNFPEMEATAYFLDRIQDIEENIDNEEF